MTEVTESRRFRFNLSALLQGWIHQANVTLFLTYGALIIVLMIIVKCVLPVNLVWGLVLIASMIIALLGVVIVSGFHVARMDSTETMTLRRDNAGLTLNAQYPSVAFVQFVQLLVGTLPKPKALIPENVDPKGDPSNFKGLSEQETIEIVSKQIQEAVNKILTPSLTPPPEQQEPGAQGTATIGPQK